MSATRTQVYLTQHQRERIDAIIEADGVTMAFVIRRALDAYLEEHDDPAGALTATFGAMPDIEAPNRDEWARG